MSTLAARLATPRVASILPIMQDRPKLLRSLAAMYNNMRYDTTYTTLRNVERLPLEVLRARSTEDTAFAPVVDYFRANGVLIESKVGAVMDALDLTQNQVDNVACYCEHGQAVSAACMARQFRRLARYHELRTFGRRILQSVGQLTRQMG